MKRITVHYMTKGNENPAIIPVRDAHGQQLVERLIADGWDEQHRSFTEEELWNKPAHDYDEFFN